MARDGLPLRTLASVAKISTTATYLVYRISRKFDVELNLAVGDFLWKSSNLIRQLQIQWHFIIHCDP